MNNMQYIKKIIFVLVLFVVPALFLSGIDVLSTVSAEDSASVTIDGLNRATEMSRREQELQRGNNQAHATIFGAQIQAERVTTNKITLGTQANLSWIRYDGIDSSVLWSQIEAEQGVRDWDQLTLFEEEISQLSEAGLIPIVVVRNAPTWAQKHPPYSCGPIREDALDDFADFMRELVERYSGPPYNVTYWEIWNEPDVDRVLVDPDHYFGCWGDQNDPYYGGGDYGEMLKHIYPAMKEANPNVQIVSAGLNLDCDPSNPPPDKDCKPAKFLEGILQNGGGDYFDIVGYHAYSFWQPAPSGDWDLEHHFWKQRGGVVLGKAHFLREVLAQFGYEKPLLLTETSLLCYEGNTACPGDEFFAAQANYIIRLYTRLWANKVLGGMWFNLDYNSWRHSDLLGPNQTPKPAYEAMQFIASLLSGATYQGALGTSTLEGYSFLKAETNSEYQIYWTNNHNTTQNLSLPPATRTVYNKLGQKITPTKTSMIEIGFEPIIIEMDSRSLYLPFMQR